MAQFIANFRTGIVLVTALVAIGTLVRQERELARMRAAIAGLSSLRNEQTEVSTVSEDLPVDIEELRRETAEVHRLRSEVAQLRREKLEVSSLRASIDKLALEVASARSGSSVSIGSSLGGFGYQASFTSPIISKAISLAQSSPQEAAQWVAALSEGKEKNQATQAVLGQWIGSEPVAAAAWTTQFPEGPLRDQAMARVGREWGMKDWNATAGWLETLPPGSSKDSAIGAYITAADGYDIKLATEWANRTEDPESRVTRVTRMAQRWLGEDNAAARAWIQQAQLPTGVAAVLLSER